MKIIKILLLIIFIGLFFTTISLAVPKKINNAHYITDVRFGFPVVFVKQDLSAVEKTYPFIAYIASPWENPTKITWSSFLLNFLIYSIISAIVALFATKNKSGEVPIGKA